MVEMCVRRIWRDISGKGGEVYRREEEENRCTVSEKVQLKVENEWFKKNLYRLRVNEKGGDDRCRQQGVNYSEVV